MEDALDIINKLLKNPSDIEDKLDSLTRCISADVDAAASKVKQAFYAKMNWLATIKQNTFKNTVPFPEISKSPEAIRLVSLAYTNLSLAHKSAKRMRDIEDEIKAFYDLFSENVDQRKINEAYETFCSLEEFRLKMYRCKDQSLNKIERAELDFVIFLLGLDLLANKEIIEDVAKIVEKEEEKDGITTIVKGKPHDRSDERSVASDSGRSRDRAGGTDALYSSPEYAQELAKIFKHYVNRSTVGLKTKIVAGIKSRIKNKVAVDYSTALNNLEVLPSSGIDSIISSKELVAYQHDALKEHFRGRSFTEPGPILKVLEFDEKYVVACSSQFFSMPPLLDTYALINTYYALSTEKISGWMGNIKNLITESFVTRDTIPAIDEESKFISINFINLLELIRNQLEPVKFKKELHDKIRGYIVREAALLKEELVSVMEDEFDDAVKLKGKPGYEEYIIMVGNSGLKVAQFADEQNDLREIFIQVLKASNSLLSEFILCTCSVAISSIFTDDWYQSKVTHKLVATIEDFLKDYEIRMFDYTFYTFVVAMIKSLTQCYIKQMARKRAVIHDDCSFRLKNDYEDFVALFSQFVEAEEIVKRMEPLKFIVPLMSVGTVDLFVVDVKALKIRFPDLTKDFVKNVLKKRTDMREDDKQEIRKRLSDIFTEEATEKRTFFSKLFAG